MNVVYFSSDFFSEMCGVSIESLCKNNTEAETICIYIVEDHITDENKNRLISVVEKYSREIVFIPMPSQKELYPEVKINLGRTYTRMAIGELLPETVERVLSLDSDTLVLDSLEELYNTEFADNEYVGGVYDCVGSAIQEKILHYDSSMKYCNAGMFIIDLNKWRANNVGTELIKKAEELSDGNHVLYFLEQDLMNLVFHNHIKVLDPRFNLLTSIYLFDYYEVIRMKKPTVYYTRGEVENARKKPALVHATTCFYVRKRMWVEKSDHPYAHWYLSYRESTPWCDVPQISDKRKTRKKLYASFWHCMPRAFAVSLATLTINIIRPKYARLTARLKLPTIAEQSSC